MATTISTINESLVDTKIVESLKYLLPAFSMFSYRPSTEAKIQSDVVYVPVATDPTAQSKTAGSALTGNGTVAGVSITVSNYYAARWDFNDATIAGAVAQNAFADKVAGAAYTVAKQVVDAATGVITAAHYGSIDQTDVMTCAAADFDQAKLALLWKIAETKIKQRQKTLMLNAGHASALMGESNLGLIFATAGQNFMGSGILPTLIGMNTIAYAGLDDNDENLVGAVIGKSAIGVATAIPECLASAGQGDLIDLRTFTEPSSGLQLQLKTFYGAGAGTLSGQVEVLYGVDKVQDAVVRLVSA